MANMEAFEGDLIRPLGFVTLYFAYAEGQLDEVLNTLIEISRTERSRPYSFGIKVGEAAKLVEKIGIEKLPGLSAILQEARPLIEARNELVHGQLFNGGRLVSKGGDRLVTSREIEELAESIFTWKEKLLERYRRELLPIISQRKI